MKRETIKRHQSKETDSKKTVYKSLGLMGLMGGGGPCAVDVKNGKIVRVRPLHYDSKYSAKKIAPFKYERNGKTFVPSLKSLPYSFSP